ncbi:cytochrome b [Marinobacter sp. AN1]|uniref:cytochrome b n=1 Tax=Marinobacter sp. AN1 TaxID=2886046 RepID=UPI002230983E|nr:cytochrome b [Marinobacter sp. AN1]UZD64559.1 cytochrome b [Marinobacter sp. AN1]
MINDSRTQYGMLSKILHWGMALLIGWQLMKFGDRIADGEHWVGQTMVPWHVSIGSLLLVLIVARIIWAASQHKHRPEQDPQTARLVKAGHGLLYAGMLLMPLTGMMVMLGGGYGVNAFGLQLIAKGEELGWAATLGSLHSPLAWALTALIIGHIGMALLHHFRGEAVLKRMV